MKLKELFADTQIEVRGDSEIEIAGISNESGKIKKKFLFFAIPGTRTHGNSHAGEAVSKGAAAIATDRIDEALLKEKGNAVLIKTPDILSAMSRAACVFNNDPSSKMKIIGITGTNGKTTVSYLLESIHTLAGDYPAVIGTVDYRAGGKRLAKASNTTPLAIELQGLLKKMFESGSKTAIMEVSSHSLSLNRVADIQFDCAIFTNLMRDHLDFHKDRQNYFNAKMKLFELSALHSRKSNRLAILNADDAKSPEITAKFGDKIRILTFGINSKADFTAEKIRILKDLSLFELKTPSGSREIKLNLIGMHNIYNALSAIACAEGMGIDLSAAIKGIELLKNVPGRLEKVSESGPFSVFVDYAHTDGALENVLINLKKLPHNRLITVFGCGGDRDRTKRAPMGKIACSMSDIAIITNDNPRTEDPSRIFDDIKRGLEGFSNYTIIPDRKEAIFRAVETAKENDTVLIAGKGHEDYQILKDKTIHFDDREVAKEAITAVTGNQ